MGRPLNESTTARRTAALALAACMMLTACSSIEPEPELTATTDAATPTETAPEPSGEAVTEIPIRIVIGDQTLDAKLWNNPAAQSLIDQLPLTLDFSDYGGQEVLATPPQPLTMEGMPSGESAPAGTIGWYAPGGVIVLYYTNVGHYNGIVRIGQMDGDVSILTGWSGSRSVTIEQAD
ncbi:cyclophilin-like fold protein [Hoyosella altamirensis]|uniref:Cyclophilin-like domain-containing protein n=1 Tax=Hoyosella altamirensis TaxID=616997 RepID=A0A839RQC6_9ACTN|nr:cyclophilin-like fold protein [Hoyosella altamirensis]MBB3038071.1 hypothetical protein [Hoyosella altamirensis]